VRDSEDEKKHKMEAQAARHHDTLDIFAEQVRAAQVAACPTLARDMVCSCPGRQWKG
jgi:hypothetical protein